MSDELHVYRFDIIVNSDEHTPGAPLTMTDSLANDVFVEMKKSFVSHISVYRDDVLYATHTKERTLYDFYSTRFDSFIRAFRKGCSLKRWWK